MIAHCPHHEFALPGVAIEARIENPAGALLRALVVKDGDPLPELAAGEVFARSLGVVLPEPEWRASVVWRPDKVAQVGDRVASVFACFDVRLAEELSTPGTPTSPICVREGRFAKAGHMQSSVGPDRFLLQCDPFGAPRAWMTIAREDGTGLGYAALDPDRGQQIVAAAEWTPVGSIRCDLGRDAIGFPCTLEWSADGTTVESELISAVTGEHLIPWLVPGEWHVRAVGPALVGREAKVEVTAGRITELDLRLARDPDTRVLVCRFSRESGTEIEDPISGDLAECDDPQNHQEFEWTPKEAGSVAIEKSLSVRRSAHLRLAVNSLPGIACRITPNVIGPNVDKVEVLLLDSARPFKPLLRIERVDGGPVERGWWYSVRSRWSNSVSEESTEEATGSVRSISPADDLMVTIASASGEFDPLLFSGSALEEWRSSSDGKPIVIKVQAPATLGRFCVFDAIGLGLAGVEARVSNGTVLRTDSWGFLTIPAGDLESTLSVPGYLFKLGPDGRAATLALSSQLAPGDLGDFTLVPAPKGAK